MFYFKNTKASQKALVRELRRKGVHRKWAKYFAHECACHSFYVIDIHTKTGQVVRVLDVTQKCWAR